MAAHESVGRVVTAGAVGRRPTSGCTERRASTRFVPSSAVAREADAGADVNATDLQGRTPLNHTEFHKAREAAKILTASGAT